MSVLLAGALVAVASALLAAGLRRSALARTLADVPNHRSLHTQPTPRVGGLAMMAVALPVAALQADGGIALLLAAATALALLSAVDDVRSLPIQLRLAAHVAAAAVAATAVLLPLGIESPRAWVEALVACVAVAWMTNLFNFMDGSDGLAGGMAMIGFGAYAAAAFGHGDAPLGWASAMLAFAAAGFLANNFPPARLFMGDAGSIPCGFLAGALGVAGFVRGAWPAWFALLVFSPFIVDATVTLVRRAARRERFWRAHREHAYQRLVLAGWSKRRLALAAYALMLAAAASAFAARGQGLMLQCGIIAVWAAMYLLLLLAIERRCRAQASGPQAPSGGFGPEQEH